ncbi:flavoprotein [Budvicia diplopodorum]|uniref:flavoprotein n=1 Tax=Budvicia diplopodorum TaxID=1119056 RepID=UPI00135841CE|nr:flavoprotein [Budvicia diplopodorum]
MSQCELSAMIDRAIIELISERVIAVLQRSKKRIAVLFTGSDQRAFIQALPQLQALSQRDYSLSLLFSYSAQPMLEQLQAEIAGLSPAHVCQPGEHTTADYFERINQSGLLLLPGLSLNTLVKSALGISDSTPSEVIAHALAQGKRIVASLCHPANSAVLPAYAANIAQHIARLQAYGVDFVDPSELVSGIELPSWAALAHPFCHPPRDHRRAEQKKRLVSLRDVLLHDPSRPFSLAPDMLLTPAARDEINRRNIQLINRIGDEYVSR